MWAPPASSSVGNFLCRRFLFLSTFSSSFRSTSATSSYFCRRLPLLFLLPPAAAAFSGVLRRRMSRHAVIAPAATSATSAACGVAHAAIGGGRKEATAVSIAATSPKYELRWTHEMRSSAANPGGAGLGLVVYEQLSVHNLTLTEKATGRTAAAASGVFGFTEWSGPA